MDTRISMAIASHLSDAQHEMSFNPDQANHRLNFVKLLIFKHEDISERVSNEYLNEIWNEAAQYNRKPSLQN